MWHSAIERSPPSTKTASRKVQASASGRGIGLGNIPRKIKNIMTITFENQVAIVTGAGRGLGQSYAKALAKSGAHVAIVDLGSSAAQTARDIRDQGGQAHAFEVDVTDFVAVEQMVVQILSDWGRIDVAINNAGILRDKTFAKMDLSDFKTVMDVHLMGSVHICKAVWQTMQEQEYGRILLTSSASGIYGNFGQANYGAAKAAMLGLMNVLHIEGERKGIRVNAILPSAATKMTEGLLSADAERLATPDAVAPGALFLVSNDAPSKVMLSAGAGSFARVHITETEGVSLLPENLTPDAVAECFDAICNPSGARVVSSAFEQADKLAASAMRILKHEGR